MISAAEIAEAALAITEPGDSMTWHEETVGRRELLHHGWSSSSPGLFCRRPHVLTAARFTVRLRLRRARNIA